MILFKKMIIFIILSLLFVNLSAYYYGKNKIQQEKIEWSVIESRHFDIHFVKGHEEFGKLTLLMAENAYYHLNQYFQQPLKNRIPIIVYSSKQEFQATNIIYPLLTEGIGGFTETLRNRVALPFDGSYKKFEEVLIHELTHAYINDIDNSFFKNPFFSSFSRYLPFWFSEGLPEYLAIAGKNNYNNMFIIDMVINDQLYDIEYLGGYFAYRLGEAILVWISENWDENKVIEYFYNIRVQSDINIATNTTFGYDFSELQKRFRLYLKRKYSDILTEFDTPWEVASRHTNAKKTYEYQNIFPRFSKSGNDYVYFSSNKGRTVIKQGSYFKLYDDLIVLTGERSARFEEFHFQRNNISFFPNDDKIAFVAKTSYSDNIYFYDITNRRVLNNLSFLEFDSIYEIDISPDGKQLALTAQKNNRCDLYIYDIESELLQQITDDNYLVYSPNWSSDGKKIAFVSERELNSEFKTPNIFSQLVKNIYYYNLETLKFHQVSSDKYDNFYPVWIDKDSKIMFITEQTNIANIDIIDLYEDKRASVTKVLSGVHSFDYSKVNESLLFSCYFDNGWDIYSIINPLENLSYYSYSTNTEFFFHNDFHAVFNTHQYRYHGKIKNETRQDKNATRDYKELRSTSKRDSLRTDFFKYYSKSFIIEERPDTTNYHIPLIRKYKPKFQIDTFWGGLAYSSSHGTIGMLQLGLSDIMGDHGLGINIDFNGEIEDSNIVMSYMYLPHRIDYGLAVYNFSDITLYRKISSNEYFELREYQTGGYFLLRYPLSRFFRLDFEQSFYKFKTEWHSWNRTFGYWKKDFSDTDYIYVPKFGFVFDNSLYGSTGPLSGQKLTSFVRHSFSKNENSFSTFYSDFRNYHLLSHRFSLANRFILGLSEGKTPERFTLSGFNGVRGLDNTNLKGSRKTLTSFELRYPFVDYLKLSFPLPVTFSQVRGSVFADIGTVWDNSSFKGMTSGRLQDLELGFGFGPRLNVGFFILKLDIAWNSDLVKHSKPSYYLTINEDF